jgi:predicted RNase H-like HicB family nuclease
MRQQLTLTARVWREGGAYVVQCLEYDVSSSGDTVEEALESLREAVELHQTPPVATILPKLYRFEIEAGAA